MEEKEEKKDAYWYNIATAKENENVPTDWEFSKWTKMSDESEIAKYARNAMEGNDCEMCFDGIALSESEYSEKTYLATYSGGLNGCGKWTDYLNDINQLLNNLGESAYIINLDNDAADDIWYLVVGFKGIDETINNLKEKYLNQYIRINHCNNCVSYMRVDDIIIEYGGVLCFKGYCVTKSESLKFGNSISIDDRQSLTLTVTKLNKDVLVIGKYDFIMELGMTCGSIEKVMKAEKDRK